MSSTSTRPSGSRLWPFVSVGVFSCTFGCGDGGTAPVEPCAGDEPVEDAVCIERVTGQFVDSDGDAPEADSLVTVCGPTCFPGRTDEQGQFSILIDSYLVLSEYSTLLHGRPTFTGFYFPVPEDAEGPELELGELTVFRLPESGTPIPEEIPDALDLDSEGVTLSIPAGSETLFDLGTIEGGDVSKQFRVLPIDAEEGASVTGEIDGVFAYYALDPFETYFIAAGDEERVRLPVSMSFPNSTDLEPETLIDVLALGSYLYRDYVTPARFDVIGQAQVTADGERIEFDGSAGMDLLTWLAFRPAE